MHLSKTEIDLLFSKKNRYFIIRILSFLMIMIRKNY
nr:MAG TPA: hypothetical protein [Bacteriophage sp.]